MRRRMQLFDILFYNINNHLVYFTPNMHTKMRAQIPKTMHGCKCVRNYRAYMSVTAMYWHRHKIDHYISHCYDTKHEKKIFL